MEVMQKNGESSTSPQRHRMDSSTPAKSRLILPEWDIPPPKHVHASQDLITLLHLDGLYDTYVRPFTEPQAQADDTAGGNQGATDGVNGSIDGMGVKVEPDGFGGGAGRGGAGGIGGGASGKGKKLKKKRLEKGYVHLLDDCMDPTPLGEKSHSTALLPLLSDAWQPPGPAPQLIEEEIKLLPPEAFQVALLEPGHRQDGYSLGKKHGVAEAEERRRRKHARHSQSIAPPENITPHLSSPLDTSPSLHSTPTLPVAPPETLPQRPSFPINTTRRPTHSARPSFASGGGGQGLHGPRHPSFSGPSRPTHSTPNSFRGNTQPPMVGGPGGRGTGAPGPSPRGSFNRGGGPNNARGRGFGGPGGGRGGRGFSRPPSFNRHLDHSAGGGFVPGHKRARESVGDPRGGEAKRSRE